METIAIVVGVVTGALAITGGAYKCYNELQNRPDRQQQRQNVVVQQRQATPPSPLLDKTIKQAIKQHIDQRNSDETDIDIKIHIETHQIQEKSNTDSLKERK